MAVAGDDVDTEGAVMAASWRREGRRQYVMMMKKVHMKTR
jgi:hypothetical protein